MADAELDLEAMAKVLRVAREGRSRRGLAEQGSLGLSQLQKLEGAFHKDVTVGTLLRAADTYGVHPLDLFCAAASISDEDVAEWVKGVGEVRALVAPENGSAQKFLIEAALPDGVLHDLVSAVERLNASASELDQLRTLVPVFTALVSALGEGYEASFGGRDLGSVRRALESSGHGDE